MTTPTHHPTTHIRFEFDADGHVVFASAYEDKSLAAGESRLYIPQVYPGTRGAIVPRDIHPVRAENNARILIEEQGGYRP
jgi:hypothetical protein